MSETAKGVMEDLNALKQRFISWLLKKLIGRNSLKSPIDVLWDMIDEENSKQVDFTDGPDCSKIDAWKEAADRISRECFGAEGEGHQ